MTMLAALFNRPPSTPPPFDRRQWPPEPPRDWQRERRDDSERIELKIRDLERLTEKLRNSGT
jgi:hypothetical protein